MPGAGKGTTSVSFPLHFHLEMLMPKANGARPVCQSPQGLTEMALLPDINRLILPWYISVVQPGLHAKNNANTVSSPSFYIYL